MSVHKQAKPAKSSAASADASGKVADATAIIGQASDVPAYIANCRPEVQELLHAIRQCIRSTAPGIRERISYGMPYYEYGGKGAKGRLLYFAAFKNHVSLFITPGDAEIVPDRMRAYHVSKATYRFSLKQDFPLEVLEETVRALIRQRGAATGTATEIH